MIKKPTYYCVVYRVGGYARYQWRRTIAKDSYEKAEKLRQSVEKQGYYCFITEYERSMKIGLPETFTSKDNVSDIEYLGNGWMNQKNHSE